MQYVDNPYSTGALIYSVWGGGGKGCRGGGGGRGGEDQGMKGADRGSG